MVGLNRIGEAVCLDDVNEMLKRANLDCFEEIDFLKFK